MARWDFREKEKMEMESELKRKAGVSTMYSFICQNRLRFHQSCSLHYTRLMSAITLHHISGLKIQYNNAVLTF